MADKTPDADLRPLGRSRYRHWKWSAPKLPPELAFVARLPETLRRAAMVAVDRGARLEGGRLVLRDRGASVVFGIETREVSRG